MDDIDFFNMTNFTTPVEIQCGKQADSPAESISNGLVAMGTLLVIAASFVSCFGVNLQKWAHNVNDACAAGDRQTMMKNWRWWLGIVCMIMGSLMDMAALPFVPLSRVAALGASTIVANIIITPIFLKETLTKHDIVGCIVTVVGTALACYWGAGAESELDSTCLLLYFKEPLFLVYASFVFVCLMVLFYFIVGFRKMSERAIAAGIIRGPNQPYQLETVWIHDNLKLVRTVPVDKHFIFVTKLGPQFYPTIHATFAGTIGAQSVMFAKAVLIFLGNALRNEDTGHSAMYLLIFLVPTVVCVWFQIKYLNVALKIYCDAIFVLPVYQSFWICTGVGSGLIFYQEYRDITGMRIAGFIIGLTIALSGLAVLARRKSRPRAARRLDDKAAHDADPPGAEAVPRSPSLLPRHKGNGNAVGQPLSKEMSSQGCSYVTSCSPPAQPLCYSDVCSTVDIDLGLEDKDKDEPGAHRPADDLRAPLSKASILTDDDDEASEATHLCRTPLSPGINGEDSDHNGTHVRR